MLHVANHAKLEHFAMSNYDQSTTILAKSGFDLEHFDLLSFVSARHEMLQIWNISLVLGIFEGVTDHKTKYIMMFILGCDQFPKGVPGIGPSHLEALINESYKGALIFVDCWAFVTCYN